MPYRLLSNSTLFRAMGIVEKMDIGSAGERMAAQVLFNAHTQRAIFRLLQL